MKLNIYHQIHNRLCRPAVVTERPLHMVYFIIAAWESHGLYSVAAGCCALVMMVSMGEKPNA